MSNYPRFSKGDGIDKLSASFLNDVASHLEGQGGGGVSGGGMGDMRPNAGTDSRTVKAVNNTGMTLHSGNIVRIAGLASGQGFKEGALFSAGRPAVGKAFGIVRAVAPVPSGQPMTVVVSGIVPCKIEMDRDAEEPHRYAEVEDDNVDHFVSAESGMGLIVTESGGDAMLLFPVGSVAPPEESSGTPGMSTAASISIARVVSRLTGSNAGKVKVQPVRIGHDGKTTDVGEEVEAYSIRVI